MKKILPLAVAFMLLLSACGPKIYETSDFRQTALVQHKVVAVLPFDVSITLRPNEAKRTTPEMLMQQQQTTGMAVQSNVYGWLLRQQARDHYTVTFQDVDRTNALLHNAGLDYSMINSKGKDELAQLLGVDSVISGKLQMSKPMSDGAAVAMALLVGAYGSTNQVNTSLTIHDKDAGKLLWKYDYVASGSIGNSPQNLTNALMRNVSKRFPYRKG